MLERLLRSGAEVKILGVVLFSDNLHLREIARRAEVSSYEAKKELDNLTQIGVLRSERKGNQIVFYANKSCPFFIDLKNLYQKTEGIFSALNDGLTGLEKIDYAFVYGSVAAGKEGEKSDIDLMVIGGINEDELSKRIFTIQAKMKREINFILWSSDDLKGKIEKKSTFLNNILKGKPVFLIGDKHEFVRIVEKGYGKKN